MEAESAQRAVWAWRVGGVRVCSVLISVNIGSSFLGPTCVYNHSLVQIKESWLQRAPVSISECLLATWDLALLEEGTWYQEVMKSRTPLSLGHPVGHSSSLGPWTPSCAMSAIHRPGGPSPPSFERGCNLFKDPQNWPVPSFKSLPCVWVQGSPGSWSLRHRQGR